MTISAILVAVLAMNALGANSLNVPEGWTNPFFGWKLTLDWTAVIKEVNAKIASDGFSLFTIFFMLMLFKGVLVSLAGPAPNYDMQKILATKNSHDAALMSGSVSLILMPIRYLMITGFVVLGLLYYDQLDLLVAGKIDFEQILPSAMERFVPIGLLGLLLAGLLAAFNSTFAGTLNAGQAYVVNDLYLKYIRPKASAKTISRANYLVGILLVAVSTVFGFFAKDVNNVLQWVVSALYGGYIAANLLKWHWWRFNAAGYFWGMAAGTTAALVFPIVFSKTLDLYYFPLLLVLSFAGSILGSILRPPTETKVLIEFYTNVRPWGFWKPIHNMILADNPDFEKNKDFKRDMFNVLIGIIWQTALVATPIFLVIKNWNYMYIALAISVVSSVLLKKFWWNHFTATEKKLSYNSKKNGQ